MEGQVKVERFVIGPLETNAYLVVDEAEVVLVDPGLESEGIYDTIDRQGLHVVAIVNTHGHFDHIAGNAFFKAKTGAPLLIHEADLPVMEGADQQALHFGFHLPQMPRPDRLLADGEEIAVGSGVLGILHTPGHTPGGICLAGPGFVLAGDTLFAGSVGRTDMAGGSFETLLSSIRVKLLSFPDDTLVYPGHGPVTTIGAERAHNPFLTGKVTLPGAG
ncbi:MAG: MBL fold metallo-hydrolase [Candidatus Methylomirabilales bacterium]